METSVLALTVLVGAVIFLAYLAFRFLSSGSKSQQSESATGPGTDESTKAEEKPAEAKTNGRTESKKKTVAKSRKQTKFQFSHPWLACSLRGHTSEILDLDFSANGKYVVTCSDDRTVLLWTVKDFATKDHKCFRGNVEFDHATKVRFSPDNKALVVSLGIENTVRVLKIGKKDDGTPGNIVGVLDFPNKYNQDIIDLGIASTGRFIMTCHRDTNLKVWDLKGELLSTIDSRQMTNSHGAVSPCGRFVVSSGFTSDVKAWEIEFDRGGNYKATSRAWELKGHSAAVHHFAFSNDSTRVATVSKDGTWRLWNVNVEYKQGGDPRLLQQGKHPFTSPCLVTLAHDLRTVAIACGTELRVYGIQDDSEQVFTDLHGGPMVALGYDNTNRFLVSVGDRQIQVLHNVPGFRATIRELEEQIRKEGKANKGLKERLQAQIDDAKSKLALAGESA